METLKILIVTALILPTLSIMVVTIDILMKMIKKFIYKHIL